MSNLFDDEIKRLKLEGESQKHQPVQKRPGDSEIVIGNHKGFYLDDKDLLSSLKEAGRQYVKEHTFNSDDIDFKDAHVNKKFLFKKWDSLHPENYARQQVTVFDTETGSNHEVISLGAIRLAFNKVTRQFEKVDAFERYYIPTVTNTRSWREAQAVHGLTPEILMKLRKQQKAKYSKYYDLTERESFVNFFKGSVLAGHNIEKADIPWALGNLPEGVGTIDTLTALINMRGRGGNKLGQAFKDVTGQTMAQAGLEAHNAMSDVQANVVLLNALLNLNNDTGKSLRYVLRHPGTHIVPTDNPDIFGPSQVAKGPFRGYLGDVNYYVSRRNLEMSKKPLDKRYDITDPETGSLKDGYHVEDVDSFIGDAEDAAQDAALQALLHGEAKRNVGPSNEMMVEMKAMMQELKNSATLFGQNLRDMTGALYVNTASSRPAKLRYLAKYVGEGGELPNETWVQEADSMHIPEADRSRMWQSSKNYKYYIEDKANELKNAREGRRISHAYERGLITADQKKDLLSNPNPLRMLDLEDAVYWNKWEASENKKRLKEKEEAQRYKDELQFSELSTYADRLTRESKREEADRNEYIKSGEKERKYREDLQFSELSTYADRLNRGSKFEEAFRLQSSRDYAKVQEAKKKGLISSKQADELGKNLGYLDDSLDKAIDKTALWTSWLKQLSNIKPYDFGQIVRAEGEGMARTFKAAGGFLPQPLMSTGRYALDIINTKRRYDFTPWQKTQDITKALGITGSLIGGAIGTVFGPGAGTVAGATAGGLIGGAIGGGINAGTQIVGNIWEGSVTRKWDQATMSMDMISLGTSLLTMPFKLLVTATNKLTKAFGGLTGFLRNFGINGLNNMASLGNPLSTLTGVKYSDYQGYEIAEGMLGLGKGALNGASEDFAKQMQLLYSTGQFNQQRMIASSMLGVFADVYGPTGSFESTVNSLAKRKLTASDMALASQINSSLPQILQVMKDIGATSLNQLKNPSFRGMYYNPIKGPGEGGRRIWDASTGRYVDERTAFRQDAYEFGTVKSTFSNSFMRLTDRLWRSGGKTVVNSLGAAFDTFASGGSLKDFLGTVKNTTIGGSTVSEWWDKIKAGLDSLWSGNLIPKLLDIVKQLGGIYLDGVDKLINSLAPLLDKGLNALMNLRLKGDIVNGFSLTMNDGNIKKARVENGDGSFFDIDKPTQQELEPILKNGYPVSLYKNGKWVDIKGQKQLENEFAFDKYTDYTEGIKNTAHNATAAAKEAVGAVIQYTPEVVESIASSLKQMTQEVVTVVRLEVVDSNGRKREISGVGNSIDFGGVRATVQGMTSKRY